MSAAAEFEEVLVDVALEALSGLVPWSVALPLLGRDAGASYHLAEGRVGRLVSEPDGDDGRTPSVRQHGQHIPKRAW